MTLAFYQDTSASAANNATSLTNILVPFQSPRRVGGVLVCQVTVRAETTISIATAGWTKVREDVAGGWTQAIFLASNVSPSNPTATWGVSAYGWSRICYFEHSQQPFDTTAIGSAAVSSGSATARTISGITSTRSQSVAVVLNHSGFVASETQDPNWTRAQFNGSSPAPGWLSIISWRHLQTSGTASGNMNVTASSAVPFIAHTIELLVANPVVEDFAGSGVQAQEAEAAVWFETPGLAVNEAEAAMWLQTVVGIEVSDAEAAIWLIADLARRRRTFTVH